MHIVHAESTICALGRMSCVEQPQFVKCSTSVPYINSIKVSSKCIIAYGDLGSDSSNIFFFLTTIAKIMIYERETELATASLRLLNLGRRPHFPDNRVQCNKSQRAPSTP